MHWLNGELSKNGRIEASSAGVTLGWGVFRTLGVAGGAARFLGRHIQRLREDARAAELDFPWLNSEISDAVEAVLAADEIEIGLARLTLTQRGDGRWNTHEGTDFSIFAVENVPVSIPARVILSRYRVEAKRALSGVKITSYLPSLWAWREAKQAGFDEAILRDGAQFTSEGARATLFWLTDGELFTPSLANGCLRGVGRDLVMQWAASRSIPLREGSFEVERAVNADEVWLVSAASGARRIGSWHDENGQLQREWAENSSLWREFYGVLERGLSGSGSASQKQNKCEPAYKTPGCTAFGRASFGRIAF